MSYTKDYLTDYKVQIKATDVAGNQVVFEKKVNGVFGGAFDFLADIWNAIAGVFSAAWEAVKDAMSFLVDWIIDFLEDGAEVIIAPLSTKIDNWKNDLASFFNEFIQSFQGTMKRGNSLMRP